MIIWIYFNIAATIRDGKDPRFDVFDQNDKVPVTTLLPFLPPSVCLRPLVAISEARLNTRRNIEADFSNERMKEVLEEVGEVIAICA